MTAGSVGGPGYVLALVTVGALVLFSNGTAGASDCSPLQPWHETQGDATYLGTYQDWFGHAASFFLAANGTTIGPLDHAAMQGTSLSFSPGGVPSASVFGDRGRLRYWARTEVHAGYFGRFESKRVERESAHAIVARIQDPLVLGLLAGRGPAMREVETRILPVPSDERRNQWPAIALGILYSADRDRARALLRDYSYEDLLNTPATLLITLIHDDTKALALLPEPQPNLGRWTDWLPRMAKLWAHGHQRFSDRFRDEVLGNAVWAEYPIDVRPSEGPMSCANRAEIGGAFDRLGDLGSHTLVALLRKRNPAFADAVVAAVRGLSGSVSAWVLDRVAPKDAKVLLMVDKSMMSLLEVSGVEYAASPVGTRVHYVASRDAAATRPVEETENLRALNFGSATHAVRFRTEKDETAALFEVLKQYAKSGNLEYYAGIAVARLFDFAEDHTGGFTIDEFRRVIWSLPGNRYVRCAEWANTWAGLLDVALLHSKRAGFSRELARAVPDLFKTFVGAENPADADALRKFLMNTGVRAVLVSLSAKDHETAARWVSYMTGPLANLVPPGTLLSPETDQKYVDSRVRPMSVLVARLTGKPAPAPVAATFELQLFAGFAKPFPPELVKMWLAELAAAGYQSAQAPDRTR